MSNRAVKLFGFEQGLVTMVAQKFSFSDVAFDDLVLEEGRHLFVSSMPAVDDLMATQGNKPFDPTREPTIGIGSNTGEGVPATSSSSSKQEWNIQVVLRLAKAPEIGKALLEDLADFLLLRRGRLATGFQIKGSKMIARPTVLDIGANDLALVSTVIKFFAVPLPT